MIEHLTRHLPRRVRYSFRLAAPLLLAACQPADDLGNRAGKASTDWEIVSAYIALDAAWHARDDEIARMDLVEDERARLRRESLGEHPDVTLAASRAVRIIQSGQPRSREAAEFLAEHSIISPTGRKNMALGVATLAKEIGPDWTRVERYLDELATWARERQIIDEAERFEHEKQDLDARLRARPQAMYAIAAAIAIIDDGEPQPRLLEAAEFLIALAAQELGAETHVLMAATALATFFPHYDDWPLVLSQINAIGAPNDELSAFVRTLAEQAEDPLVRATARYYAAAMLVAKIDAGTVSAVEREAIREQAIKLVTGMSTGVEQVQFGSEDAGEAGAKTFAQQESELLAAIEAIPVD